MLFYYSLVDSRFYALSIKRGPSAVYVQSEIYTCRSRDCCKFIAASCKPRTPPFPYGTKTRKPGICVRLRGVTHVLEISYVFPRIMDEMRRFMARPCVGNKRCSLWHSILLSPVSLLRIPQGETAKPNPNTCTINPPHGPHPAAAALRLAESLPLAMILNHRRRRLLGGVKVDSGTRRPPSQRDGCLEALHETARLPSFTSNAYCMCGVE